MGAPTLGPNDNDPRIALHEYWDRLKQLDAKIHLTFTSKFPRSMRVADWAIEHLYLCCASPTVALVVTFLLVPLVITDSISLITFISVSAAWLIAVLGIAKATWVNSLRISARLGILFISGLLMAVAGR